MNCERCGIWIEESIIQKREARGVIDHLCRDCKAKPTREVKYNNEICRPWWGELDDDFNPIDKKGKLYLPGPRICGHKDCVSSKHILRDPELERIDISYRTGKRATLELVERELVA